MPAAQVPVAAALLPGGLAGLQAGLPLPFPGQWPAGAWGRYRQRLVVARSLLSDVRPQPNRALAGERQLSLLPLAEVCQRQRLQVLFVELDRDGNGSLSVADLAEGLEQRPAGTRHQSTSPLPLAVPVVDPDEFAELMLRLRRLQEGRERLLTYLQPVDADGNDPMEPAELDRLLGSVGHPRLHAQEGQPLFGSEGRGLSWGDFVDRLLPT